MKNPLNSKKYFHVHETFHTRQKAPLSKISHTYPTMMKLSTDILYLKKIQKYI